MFGQFRALAATVQNMEKFLEESVVPAEFGRGTKEQEGRQMAKIPKVLTRPLSKLAPTNCCLSHLWLK